MSYCTIAQIQAIIAGVEVSGVTEPNSTQWQTLADMRQAEIDAALAYRGYVVPITAPQTFVNELAALNARATAADVLLQAMPAFAEAGTIESPLGRELLDDFTARITELEEGIRVPVGVMRNEVQQSPEGLLTETGAWGMPDYSATDDAGNYLRASPLFSVEKSL